mmetsp:Transcript_53283/g.158933  ORF Transcript_53283/g.158933 Transcript_53283/m.158933 type:complete len:201 (+) Transcript_53283:39-641(+)
MERPASGLRARRRGGLDRRRWPRERRHHGPSRPEPPVAGDLGPPGKRRPRGAGLAGRGQAAVPAALRGGPRLRLGEPVLQGRTPAAAARAFRAPAGGSDSAAARACASVATAAGHDPLPCRPQAPAPRPLAGGTARGVCRLDAAGGVPLRSERRLVPPRRDGWATPGTGRRPGFRRHANVGGAAVLPRAAMDVLRRAGLA